MKVNSTASRGSPSSFWVVLLPALSPLWQCCFPIFLPLRGAACSIQILYVQISREQPQQRKPDRAEIGQFGRVNFVFKGGALLVPCLFLDGRCYSTPIRLVGGGVFSLTLCGWCCLPLLLFVFFKAGTVPSATRWLTRARLCWQREEEWQTATRQDGRAPAPRPTPSSLRTSTRSSSAPRLCAQHQWSISLPGAWKALCHKRSTIEPMVASGTLELLVAADLDLVNMFGNAEWPRIRRALRTHFLVDRVGLCHLPSHPEARWCWARRRNFLSSPLEAKGVCDECFVDGG